MSSEYDITGRIQPPLGHINEAHPNPLTPQQKLVQKTSGEAEKISSNPPTDVLKNPAVSSQIPLKAESEAAKAAQIAKIHRPKPPKVAAATKGPSWAKVALLAIGAIATLLSGQAAANPVPLSIAPILPNNKPLRAHPLSLESNSLTAVCLPHLPFKNQSFPSEVPKVSFKDMLKLSNIAVSVHIVYDKIVANEPFCEHLALDTMEYLLVKDLEWACHLAFRLVPINNHVAEQVIEKCCKHLIKKLQTYKVEDQGTSTYKHFYYLAIQSIEYNTPGACKVAENWGDFFLKQENPNYPVLYSTVLYDIPSKYSLAAQKLIQKVYELFPSKALEFALRGVTFSNPSPFFLTEYFKKFKPESNNALIKVFFEAVPSKIPSKILIDKFIDYAVEQGRTFALESLNHNTDQARTIAEHYFEKCNPEQAYEMAFESLHHSTSSSFIILDQYIEKLKTSDLGLDKDRYHAFLVESLIGNHKEAREMALNHFETLLTENPQAALSFSLDFLKLRSKFGDLAWDRSRIPAEICRDLYEKLLKKDRILAYYFLYADYTQRTDPQKDAKIVGITLGAAIALFAKWKYKRTYGELPFKFAYAYGKIIDAFVSGIADQNLRQQIFTVIGTIPGEKLASIAQDCLRGKELVPQFKGEALLTMLNLYKEIDDPSERDTLNEFLQTLNPEYRLTVAKRLIELAPEKRAPLLKSLGNRPDKNTIVKHWIDTPQEHIAKVFELCIPLPLDQYELAFLECKRLIGDQLGMVYPENTATTLELLTELPPNQLIQMLIDLRAMLAFIPLGKRAETGQSLVKIIRDIPAAERARILHTINALPRDHRADLIKGISRYIEELVDVDQKIVLFESLADIPHDKLPQQFFIGTLDLIPTNQKSQAAKPILSFYKNTNINGEGFGILFMALAHLPAEERTNALIYFAPHWSHWEDVHVSHFQKSILLHTFEDQHHTLAQTEHLITFLTDGSISNAGLEKIAGDIYLVKPVHRLQFIEFYIGIQLEQNLQLKQDKLEQPLLFFFQENPQVKNDSITYLYDSITHIDQNQRVVKHRPTATAADLTFASAILEWAEPLGIQNGGGDDVNSILYRSAVFLRQDASEALEKDVSNPPYHVSNPSNPYQMYMNLRNTDSTDPLIQGQIKCTLKIVVVKETEKRIVDSKGNVSIKIEKKEVNIPIRVRIQFDHLRKLAHRQKITYSQLPPQYEEQSFEKHFTAFETHLATLNAQEKIQLQKEIQKVCRKANTDQELNQILAGVDPAALANMSPQNLRMTLGSGFILQLINKRGNPNEPVGNTKFYLHSLLKKLDDLSDVRPTPTQLSERERMLFSLAYEFRICSTGQEDGIRQHYNTLPDEYRLRGNAAANAKETIESTLDAAIGFQEIIAGILASPALLHKLTKIAANKRIPQESHQTQYLLNYMHRQLGLHHKISFDAYSSVVVKGLLSLTQNEILKEVLFYLPIKSTITKIQQAMADKMKNPDMKFYMKLQEYLEPLIPAQDKEGWQNKYMTFGNDDTPLGVTELGALTLMKAIGFISSFSALEVKK